MGASFVTGESASFITGESDTISTDDDDDDFDVDDADEGDDDGEDDADDDDDDDDDDIDIVGVGGDAVVTGLVLSGALPNILFDLDTGLDVDVVVDANTFVPIDANGGGFGDAIVFDGVNLNVSAGASTGLGLATGSSIFLLSIIGAFGAGNEIGENLISALFNIS